MTQLKYDGLLSIATGRSRKETHWRNTEILWSDLLKRFAEVHRTAESYDEFMAAPKTRQDEIKDVGGFVGGYVSGGRRKTEAITNRSLITLDIDFGDIGVYENFELLYGNACALYTTHKHGPGNFRGRLVIPLARPVFRDEYLAIARRIAGMLGIENFDDTTYEPARLMYWPSAAKDGAFEFRYLDAPFIDPDELLATYQDWRDVSSWPVSNRLDKRISREIKKQGDPLEKPGLIGAFCRCYTIQDAVETFLGDAYEPCGGNRYTYKQGSTAAGLAVYEDKFAYSHHGTDPASGRLCNAFDLVRIHKFGLKDEDAKENTAGNRLPSYTAMVEYASSLPEVRKQIVGEKTQSAQADFAGVQLEEEQEQDDSWQGRLGVDRKGRIYSTIDNIVVIAEHDPKLKGKLALNEFEHREVMLGDLPWRKFTPKDAGLTDRDDANIRYYFEKIYEITGKQKLQDGVSIIMERHKFHPIKSYLEGLTWDGIPRLETLLIDYLGAEDCPYIRAVTRKTFVAAVARIYQPGVKFDNVLTLIGRQGAGKSTLFKKMGGDWYSDSLDTIVGKEAYEQLQGTWIVEWSELAGLKKADIERIKQFITKQVDRYRVAYGRRVEDFPRQIIFTASSNNRDFLKDTTGNRRFWPVDIDIQPRSKNVFEELDGEVNQLWAEAMALYQMGEKLYLDAELELAAQQQQREHMEVDDRYGGIQDYLNTPVPKDWAKMDLDTRRNYLHNPTAQDEGETYLRERICVAEIWCELYYGSQRDLTRQNANPLHNIMRQMEGWEKLDTPTGKMRYPLYGVQRGYQRAEKGCADSSF